MKMKCIIIDDEPLAREGVALNAKDVEFIELVEEFSNPVVANSYLKKEVVDLMFLDIQMPGINGLDFLRDLDDPPLTILTTAHSEYALEGFNLNVVDYLVKPIRLNRFLKAVNKARELFELKSTDHPVRWPNPSEDRKENSVYIKSNRKFIKLKFDEIVVVEGMKDYVLVHTSEERFPVAMNLKTFNSNLPNVLFARINKSNVVNVKHISEIVDNHVILPKHKLSIGRSYKEDFLNTHIMKKLIDRK